MDINKFHPLLQKQINKHLTEECKKHDLFANFIKVVNDSYQNFDRDKDMFEHAAQINERDYAEINNKLKTEIKQRKLSIEKLIEAIYSLETKEGLENQVLDPNNLLGLVDYLQIQIEKRKKTERELILAKDIAEKSTKAKSEFLSMMSHEIRTPLNAIVGMTYLMQQESLSKVMEENLKILQFSTDNLHVLINDILDFSKIEAGKVDLELIPFDLKQLLSNIKKSNQIKAEEKENKIRLMVDDDIPNLVIGDPLRLGQILSNLVSNAVKFTKEGSIAIELALLKNQNNKVTLKFSVTDTGIGIPPEKQSIIFNKFTQANSETTRQYGGTGLGLVITKKLLELHGSEINLISEAGKGSTFYFTIDLEIANAVENSVKQGNNDLMNENTLNGLRVLLVEDYPINITIATRFLEKWKLVVDVAENGQIAVDKFETGKYDLILMDIQMPIMDGYTAAKKIREIDTEIPIIALTASANFDNQDKAFFVGMNDYVTKPFNPNELFHKIAKYSLRK